MRLDDADRLGAELVDLIHDASEYLQGLDRMRRSARAQRRDMSPTELGVVARSHAHLLARWRALHQGE